MRVPREDVLAYFRKTYEEEYDALGEEGIGAILERGRSWSLGTVMSQGGALVFPHVHIADCGPYTAAVVDACLACGADQVLAIGVLHAFTDEMERAKARIAAQDAGLEGEPLRGIYGEGLPGSLDCWRQDHSLYGFARLLHDAARLRGVPVPRLILRYPFLTGPRPESLPGIEELATIAKDSAVVSTADHCHHGIGYGHSRQEALYFDEAGLAKVRGFIEDGLALLDAGRYREYLAHCVAVVKSDWRDAGPVVHHLCGPLRSTVLGIVPSDFSKSIYQAPAPTWCAGALVSCEPTRL
jgi:hypothetical protein